MLRFLTEMARTYGGAFEEERGDALVGAPGRRRVVDDGAGDVHCARVRRRRAADAVEARLQPRRYAPKKCACGCSMSGGRGP